VGFSPDLVMAVYVGYDNPQSLGKDETGASVAMPIFIDFMKDALKNKASIPFRVPNSVKLVKIDKLTGKYATPLTPKSQLFFEALKINDEIIENQELGDEEQGNLNPENSSPSTGSEENQPSGIY
ncbi:MAG: penicillin-binding protein 1A, partial [Alphaproteobacteria bacterium]